MSELTLYAGPYPERHEKQANRVDRMLSSGWGYWAPRLGPTTLRLSRHAERVIASAPEFADMDDAGILAKARELGAALLRQGFEPPLVARAFAMIREVTARKLGMRHYKVQIMGGWTLLEGRLAEMRTGEGKTITALLPAATAALAGMPVHVITVNDYLAERDSEETRPVYEALGLTVGLVKHGMEPPERRAAYGQDITFCTNKEVTFDYLRDRIALGDMRSSVQLKLEKLAGGTDRTKQLVMRGLHFCIIDEADSVLIDEARTPLIISREVEAPDTDEPYATALAMARDLKPGTDYRLHQDERAINLLDAGQEKLSELSEGMRGLWGSRRAREELIEQALSALHFFQLDTHYIIAEDKVQIVDEYTGRIMADRSWERGLHQLIEVKEGVPVTGGRETIAKITYQTFFRRYLRLAGMTGTGYEVAPELWADYRLRVVRIPTNRKPLQVELGRVVYATADDKWTAVVARVADMSRRLQRPVLVGTRSVEASEHLSELLDAADLPHVVLNARQDKEEAETVAQAGQPGRITVATNIAGRGTDIKLAPGVAEAGGLHVILTEYHELARIDRQLFGRAGRQGDHGSFEAIVSLEDELLLRFAGPVVRAARTAIVGRRRLGHVTTTLLRRVAQGAAESLHAKIRGENLRSAEQTEKGLGFAKLAE